MKIAALLVLMLPASALAEDPNFLTPRDLPAKASQIFGAMGRGQMPDFPKGYGIEEALRANIAAQTCMAPVGRQLTEWTESRNSDGFYWHYNISAQFECRAPRMNTAQYEEKAEKLSAALKDVTSVGTVRRMTKSALVLCFERLEQVCDGNVLIRYQNRETCELQDLSRGNSLIILDDLVDGSTVIRNEGARALSALLPVHRDGRRDDRSGGNCAPHEYNRFKGISRKSAKVTCATSIYGTDCLVEGIIKE